MPGDNYHIINLARRLRSQVHAPVIGGIAVYLHGVGRSTVDLDFYAADRRVTADELESAGAAWDTARREHVLDGVPIHTITPEDCGVVIGRTSTINGVLVVTLKDLVAIKLLSGLNNMGRSRDLGDVEDLIRCVPLDKRFAAKLPPSLRKEFKAIVDAVRTRERNLPPDHRF